MWWSCCQDRLGCGVMNRNSLKSDIKNNDKQYYLPYGYDRGQLRLSFHDFIVLLRDSGWWATCQFQLSEKSMGRTSHVVPPNHRESKKHSRASAWKERRNGKCQAVWRQSRSCWRWFPLIGVMSLSWALWSVSPPIGWLLLLVWASRSFASQRGWS